jgi:geranylgeranyl reductase family protein
MSEREFGGHWDVVIVGAGPAGSSTALPLAEAGCKVLLLERRSRVGVPVQCAEYIPQPLAGEVGAPPAALAQRVKSLRTFIRGSAVAENRWPGVVVNRDALDQHLVYRAVARGATLLTGCRVKSIEDHAVVFRQQGGMLRVTACVIVGADGPASVTGRHIGLRNLNFVYGLQVEAPLAEPLDHTQAHFREEFVGGYAWVFPKGDTANVGIGVERIAAKALPRLLTAFLEELRALGIIAGGPVCRRTGGLIPIGGPLPQSVRDHVLLVGDAAGQTDAVTGGGIPAAIHGGEIAGQAIREALAAGDPAGIRRYEEQWRDLMGRTLARSLGHRRRQTRDWNLGPFDRLIRRTWIAFPEYYHAC